MGYIGEVKRRHDENEDIDVDNANSCGLCNKAFPSEEKLYKHLLCCAIGEDDTTKKNDIDTKTNDEETELQSNLNKPIKKVKSKSCLPQINVSNEAKLEGFLKD